jgi:hypothetical protein
MLCVPVFLSMMKEEPKKKVSNRRIASLGPISLISKFMDCFRTEWLRAPRTTGAFYHSLYPKFIQLTCGPIFWQVEEINTPLVRNRKIEMHRSGLSIIFTRGQLARPQKKETGLRQMRRRGVEPRLVSRFS